MLFNLKICSQQKKEQKENQASDEEKFYRKSSIPNLAFPLLT
jgi:hypothetical protein